jgi:hypothetical protein
VAKGDTGMSQVCPVCLKEVERTQEHHVNGGKQVTVRFDSKGRFFVFTHPQTGTVLKRCPAKKLDVPAITVET